MFKPGDKVRLIYKQNIFEIPSESAKCYLLRKQMDFRTIYTVQTTGLMWGEIKLEGFNGQFNPLVFQLEED